MAVITAVASAVGAACAAALVGRIPAAVGGSRARRRLLAEPSSSPAPWLPVPAPVQRAFARAGLAADADRLWGCWCGAVAIAVAAAPVTDGGPVLVLATVAGPAVVLALRRDEARRRRIRQLPDALEAVAASLRGGSALPAAVADAASIGPPLGPELASIAAETGAGRPLAAAVAGWADQAPDPPSRLAAAGLAVAAEVGGPGARALDGAAASLRERRALDEEARSLSTQGRLSALVLTVSPIGFAFLLTTLDPASAQFLLGTPAGWTCIVVGLGLDALGAWWMSRLVRAAR